MHTHGCISRASIIASRNRPTVTKYAVAFKVARITARSTKRGNALTLLPGRALMTETHTRTHSAVSNPMPASVHSHPHAQRHATKLPL